MARENLTTIEHYEAEATNKKIGTLKNTERNMIYTD